MKLEELKTLAFNMAQAKFDIDPNCGVNDFATAIGLMLINEYGEHNYEPFINQLKDTLIKKG